MHPSDPIWNLSGRSKVYSAIGKKCCDQCFWGQMFHSKDKGGHHICRMKPSTGSTFNLVVHYGPNTGVVLTSDSKRSITT